MNLRLDKDLLQLLELIRESASDTRVYLVGGAIRDLLLGRPAKDLDFVQAQGSIRLAKAVSRRLHGAMYTLDDVRHSARVILRQGEQDEQILDFTSFIGENLQEDLRQRDFTINAMAFDLDAPEELIDPLGGESDLRDGQLRLCGPDSLTSDPLRVLRGVRLISSYDLGYGFEIIAAMRVASKKLGLVSGERIRDELFKCLEVPNFGTTLTLLNEFGILDQLRLLVFGVDPVEPPLQGQSNKLYASLAGLKDSLSSHADKDNSLFVLLPKQKHLETYQAMLEEPLQGGRKRRYLLLLCSLLLHIHPLFDEDKKDAVELVPGMFSEQVAQAFLTGQKERAYFQAISGAFLRLAILSASRPGKLDYYRFFRDFGAYGLDSALLGMVETETHGQKLQFSPEILQEVFYTWFEEQSQIVNPPRLVDGNQLQRELSVGPGSQIGFLLEAIREQQVLGNINTAAEAIAFARNEIRRKV
jgi:tRNA nucleotidyltransferase/poly(A) polymerase